MQDIAELRTKYSESLCRARTSESSEGSSSMALYTLPAHGCNRAQGGKGEGGRQVFWVLFFVAFRYYVFRRILRKWRKGGGVHSMSQVKHTHTHEKTYNIGVQI